ncbi:MAG: HAMP domain-containing histidine kinase [Gammaproteobacteria bacterium]|nr:HAMP domain-containing histidine kinase [Gammaproteobacteria bacterium]MDH5652938.1 HAMP domain-containing histidine kinase [Gammaproteobacteria bacterium]
MQPSFTRHILIAGFIAVTVVTLVLNLFWYVSTQEMKKSLAEMQDRFTISRLIHTMSDTSRLRALSAHRMLLMDDQLQRYEEEVNFNYLGSKFLGAREQLLTHAAFNHNDKQAWDALKDKVNAGGELHRKIVDHLVDENDAMAVRLLQKQSLLVQDAFITGFDTILSDKNDEMIAIVRRTEESREDYLTLVMLSSGMAFLVFLIAYLLAYRYIMRTERALVIAHEKEKMENEYKNEFMARASHELRTPLNAILGFAQVINMDTDNRLPKEHAVYFKHIEQSGWQLLALLDNIMDLTRITAQKITLNIESVSLRSVIENCATSMSRMAKNNRVKLEYLFLDSNVDMLETDCSRISQIIENLVSNAIKYNVPDGTVMVTANELTNDMIHIEVSNTGAGIDTQDIAKLFKPFANANNMQANDGRGIGLVLTKGLVECLGGRLGVESKPGELTRFWVDIPRLYQSHSAQQAACCA